jgi:hypothetical protein
MFHDGFGAKGLPKGTEISPFLSNIKGVSTKCAKIGTKWGEKGRKGTRDTQRRVDGGGQGKRGGEMGETIDFTQVENVTGNAARESDGFLGRGGGARTGRGPHLRRGAVEGSGCNVSPRFLLSLGTIFIGVIGHDSWTKILYKHSASMYVYSHGFHQKLSKRTRGCPPPHSLLRWKNQVS